MSFLARFNTAFLTFDKFSMKNGKFAGSVGVWECGFKILTVGVRNFLDWDTSWWN